MFANLYQKLINREEKLSLIGLGYVGMPIAVAFAKKLDVIGFDLNEKKRDFVHLLFNESNAERILKFGEIINGMQ